MPFGYLDQYQARHRTWILRAGIESAPWHDCVSMSAVSPIAITRRLPKFLKQRFLFRVRMELRQATYTSGRIATGQPCASIACLSHSLAHFSHAI